MRTTFTSGNTDPIYDAEGLIVAAMSNIIAPMKFNKVEVTMPPEVEKIEQLLSTMNQQVRHSYTARLRLELTDPSVNVGIVLKKCTNCEKMRNQVLCCLSMPMKLIMRE